VFHLQIIICYNYNIMTEKLIIKTAERLQDSMSPEDIKRTLGELLGRATEDNLADLSEKIKNIRAFILDKYSWDACVSNPYWHALAGSSMKGKSAVSETPTKVEQEIYDSIIGSVKRLKESVEIETGPLGTESSSALIREVAAFRDKLAIDPGAREYFNREMNTIVRDLQKEYPDQNLSRIPEIQYIISGSEVGKGEEIPATTTILVIQSVTEAYLNLKKKIEEEFKIK
jgi:hypothetical protein